MKFEAVVANPPFLAQWSANDLFMVTKGLVNMEDLPQNQKLIMLLLPYDSSSFRKRILSVVMPLGALFRNAEEEIEK